MKRLLALILACALCLSFAACGSEDAPTNDAVPPQENIDDGKNAIKGELEEFSLSEVLSLFSQNVDSGADAGELLGVYDAEIKVPKNTLPDMDEVTLRLKDGIVAFSAAGEETYLSVSGGKTLVVTSSEGNGYVAEELAEDVKLDTGRLVSYLEECASLAETYLELPKIEQDALMYESGVYYLGDEYTDVLIKGAFYSAFCLSNQREPATLTDSEKAEIDASAAEFCDVFNLKIGFGVKMKRINTLYFECFGADAGEYLEGEAESIDAKVVLALDSSRTYVERLSVEARIDSEKNGDQTLSLLEKTSYTGTKLSGVEMKLDLGYKSGLIATDKTESGADARVYGDGRLSFALSFGTGASSNCAVAYSTESTPTRVEFSEGYTPSDDELSDLMDATNYKSGFGVQLAFGLNGVGSATLEIKRGDFSAKTTVPMKFGKNLDISTAPTEVKELIESFGKSE